MSNYQTIDLPSAMLTQQANARVQFLIEQYYANQLSSPSDVMQAASAIFQDFFTNLGRPLVSTLVFAGLPIAEDWNVYQRRAFNDISILFNQTADLSIEAATATNFANIENEMLAAAANSLKNQVSSFQATRQTGYGLKRWVAGDDFYDSSRIDTTNTTALVTTGSVSLSRVSATDYANQITLVVDDEYVTSILAQNQIPQISSNTTLGPTGLSNGFVGTTHEVIVNENTNTTPTTSTGVISLQTSTSTTNAISFVGDYGLHTDINTVLDNDPSTWFEYEVCNIPDTYKQDPCNNYGFTMSLGRSDGTSLDIPWYAFHDNSTSISDTNSAVPQASLFPPLPTTAKIGPYTSNVTPTGNYSDSINATINPSTGQSTSTLAVSGSSIVFSDSGAPRIGGVLRLALNGTLNTDVLMSNISILPNIFNGCVPVIASVQVKGSNDADWTNATPIRSTRDLQEFIDISGTLPALTSGSTNEDLATFAFPPRLVTYIRIVIEQPQSYDTNIGHIVWATTNTGINVLAANSPDVYNALFGGQPHNDNTLTATSVTAVRSNGPEISLENLVTAPDVDSKLDPTKNTVQPTGSLGAVVGLITGIASYLSGSTSNIGSTNTNNTTQLSGPYIEYFPGWRYAIGIRDIGFGIYSYAVTSTLISKDFTVPVDIKKISLQVHEEIPNSTDVPQYITGTEWIAYSISFDGGSTWWPIAPTSHYFAKEPKIYQVNPNNGAASVASSQGAALTSNYDSVNNPVDKVRLRAVIKRPEAVDNLSPALYRYQLILEGNSI